MKPRFWNIWLPISVALWQTDNTIISLTFLIDRVSFISQTTGNEVTLKFMYSKRLMWQYVYLLTEISLVAC
jgi:hypothetical protein